MTGRVFRTEQVLAHPPRCVVYDPCTGLTHAAIGQQLGAGRVCLDDAAVAAWPIVHPRELRRPVPVSVCWSPIVRCNLACPHCLDDKSVPEGDRRARTAAAARIGAAGVLGVDISGGEPLLLPDLPDLAQPLIEAGCAVS
jgi:hypothetical protein